MNKPESSSEEKIRIAYVLQADVRGGVEEHVLSLIKHIDKSKYQSYLIAPTALADSLANNLEPGEATILHLRISRFFDINGSLKLYRFLRQHRIHILHTHLFVATFFYAPVAKLAGVPILLETNHLLEKYRLDKGFFKRHSFIVDKIFSGLLDKMLTVSHACKQDLVRIKGIAADRITVVHNGRDLENFKPAFDGQRLTLRRDFGFAADDFIFGVFARLNFQKGHCYLLEALHLLNTRGRRVKFVFVGEGELRQELEELSERLCVSDQVMFAGFQKDVPAMLEMMDVTVLSSLYEGLPLSVIESLAMERPVIATAVDGTPEIVRDHENGLLVPPRDPEALANAIEYALSHRDEMIVMGKEGREFVVKHFSLKRQIAETEAVYKELCCSRGILIPLGHTPC